MLKIILCAIVSCSSIARADVGFTNINQSEFKDFVEEFGASFVHTSVSGASSLGKIFGFEIGLIAGASESETLERLVKEQDPNSDFDKLVHAGIFGAITFPLGLTAEINFLPEVESEVDFKTGSFGLKWTPTDIWPLPVELALKLHTAHSTVAWNQVISTVPTNVEYDQTVTGLLFQVSKQFTVFEPYLNVGSVRAKGKLTVQSSGTVFDPSYTTSSSSEEDVKGSQLLAGINFNLGIVKLGAEAGRVFDSNVASLKVSLYF